jgi:hypothetical protein
MAKIIANTLKNSRYTPIDVTVFFIISGLFALIAIVYEYYYVATIFLILKSILDGADGELARIKNTPSYIGRFLDSIADIFLNFLLILVGLLAFLCLQLQGTLYNYYYTIMRSQLEGDQTSRIFENKIPEAFPQENQKYVTIMYKIYRVLYGFFDEIVYKLDRNALNETYIPAWFMTCLSVFGLGFQLLFIGMLFILGCRDSVCYIVISATLLVPVFVLVRRQMG